MEPIIWIFIFTGLITLLTQAVIRSPLWVSFLVYLGGSALLVGYWNFVTIEASWFAYVKLFSVVVGALYVTILRYKSWGSISWLKLTGYLLIIINMLEAMVHDVFTGTPINAVVGGVLLLTLAFPYQIFVDPKDPKRNFRYNLGIAWVLAYTAWDFVFIYGVSKFGEGSPFAAFAICHLVTPLLLMGKTGDLYMQARAHSLSLYMFVRMSIPYEPFFFETPNWYNPTFQVFMQVIAIGLTLWTVYLAIQKIRTTENAQNIVQLLFLPFIKSKKDIQPKSALPEQVYPEIAEY